MHLESILGRLRVLYVYLVDVGRHVHWLAVEYRDIVSMGIPACRARLCLCVRQTTELLLGLAHGVSELGHCILYQRAGRFAGSG